MISFFFLQTRTNVESNQGQRQSCIITAGGVEFIKCLWVVVEISEDYLYKHVGLVKVAITSR